MLAFINVRRDLTTFLQPIIEHPTSSAVGTGAPEGKAMLLDSFFPARGE